MNTDLFNSAQIYSEETYEEAMMRYSGFGKELYLKIQEELPEVFSHLVYYREIKYQPEDSYAIYNSEINSFAIQLDPLCEVIVLWNKQVQTEIGSWANNKYEEAIAFIKEML